MSVRVSQLLVLHHRSFLPKRKLYSRCPVRPLHVSNRAVDSTHTFLQLRPSRNLQIFCAYDLKYLISVSHLRQICFTPTSFGSLCLFFTSCIGRLAKWCNQWYSQDLFKSSNIINIYLSVPNLTKYVERMSTSSGNATNCYPEIPKSIFQANFYALGITLKMVSDESENDFTFKCDKISTNISVWLSRWFPCYIKASGTDGTYPHVMNLRWNYKILLK